MLMETEWSFLIESSYTALHFPCLSSLGCAVQHQAARLRAPGLPLSSTPQISKKTFKNCMSLKAIVQELGRWEWPGCHGLSPQTPNAWHKKDKHRSPGDSAHRGYSYIYAPFFQTMRVSSQKVRGEYTILVLQNHTKWNSADFQKWV